MSAGAVFLVTVAIGLGVAAAAVGLISFVLYRAGAGVLQWLLGDRTRPRGHAR